MADPMTRDGDDIADDEVFLLRRKLMLAYAAGWDGRCDHPEGEDYGPDEPFGTLQRQWVDAALAAPAPVAAPTPVAPVPEDGCTIQFEDIKPSNG